jgi:hypothetical protein
MPGLGPTPQTAAITVRGKSEPVKTCLVGSVFWGRRLCRRFREIVPAPNYRGVRDASHNAFGVAVRPLR